MKSGFAETYTYCTVCRSDFGIAKHVKTSKHMAKTVDSRSSTHKISNFFINSSGKNFSIIRAEVMFTDFLVKQNMPLFPPHIFGRDLSHIFILKCLHVCSRSCVQQQRSFMFTP